MLATELLSACISCLAGDAIKAGVLLIPRRPGPGLHRRRASLHRAGPAGEFLRSPARAHPRTPVMLAYGLASPAT